MAYDYANPVDVAMLRIWFSELAGKHLQGCRPMCGSDDWEYLAHYADWDFKGIYGFFSAAGRAEGSEPLNVGAVSGWTFKEKDLEWFVFGDKAWAGAFEEWKGAREQAEQSLVAAYCEGGQKELDAAAQEMARASRDPGQAPASAAKPRR